MNATATDKRQLRVVICDPHEFSRSAISELLRSELDLCVVGEYCTAEAALFDYDTLQPDVAILNPTTIDASSMRICNAFTASGTPTGCVVLSSVGDDSDRAAADEVGAALLLKTSSMRDLAPTIREVAARA